MTEDPFAHLHDEGYAAATDRPRLTEAGLVTLAGRDVISLDGDWHATPDLFDEGLRQRWYLDDDAPPSAWRTLRDHELWAADKLSVPGCWTMQNPALRHFEGAVWYARRFTWDNSTPRLMLHVGAAAYGARVFLNGTPLGAHLGASTPFCVELTSHLRAGENRLLIQVDNRRSAERVPMHHFDWFNDGGLHRTVSLVKLPEVFIRSTRIWFECGSVQVHLSLSDAASGPATLTIPDLAISSTIDVIKGEGRIAIPADPLRWSPETPILFDVTLSFGADSITERTGFREIATAGTDILLNGRSIYLRGICIHEDDALLGRTTTDEDLQRRFAHLRDLGCNFARLAHYPHDPRVAQLADAHGILLWAEIPVYWAIDFANPATYADAENQLQELIARDINRCSIILWGVGNENADTNARYVFMSRLADAARAADPTRLIGAACLINRETFQIADRLAAHLDVIGLNEYFGWYEPDLDGLRRLLANSTPDKPVVISETGADAVAGRRGPDTELFTEDNQARIYRAQLDIIAEFPWLRGFVPWLLYDFRSERRQTGLQRGWNRKGLIAEDKTTRKLAFDVLAARYRDISSASPPDPE